MAHVTKSGSYVHVSLFLIILLYIRTYVIANVFGTAMKSEEESQKEEESRIGQDVWKSQN